MSSFRGGERRFSSKFTIQSKPTSDSETVVSDTDFPSMSQLDFGVLSSTPTNNQRGRDNLLKKAKSMGY